MQVKATQGRSVALRAEPQHLIVLYLGPTGDVSEVFNGPGSFPWSASGAMQRNGQRPIGVAKLRELMNQVPESKRIAEVRK